MNELRKVAVFLFIIGLEKGQKIMNLMDNGELKNVLGEMGRLKEISPKEQKQVWQEFIELGYEETMNPVETMFVLRQCFHGSRMCDKETRR